MEARPELILLLTTSATRLHNSVFHHFFLLPACLHKSCYLAFLPWPISFSFAPLYLKSLYTNKLHWEDIQVPHMSCTKKENWTETSHTQHYSDRCFRKNVIRSLADPSFLQGRILLPHKLQDRKKHPPKNTSSSVKTSPATLFRTKIVRDGSQFGQLSLQKKRQEDNNQKEAAQC